MTEGVKAKVALGFVVLVLTLGIGSAVLEAVKSWQEDGAARLNALVRKKAPLSEAQRKQEDLNAGALVQEDPEFRRWFAGVVTSDDVAMKVRGAASEWLHGHPGVEAMVDGTVALMPGVGPPRGPGPAVRGELNLRAHLRTYWFTFKVMETDLPAEELLELLDRCYPEWRPGSQAFLNMKPRKPEAGASAEETKRFRRLSEVQALAQRRDEATLLARVQAEAPLPEGREPTLAGLPGLAEDDPAFRKWLAGIVAAPEEDNWLRGLAFEALLDMQSDKAVKALVHDLNAWCWDRDVELDRQGRGQQKGISALLLDRLLLTDLPIEDVLKPAKGCGPHWQAHAGTIAAGDWRAPDPWTEEQHARLQERARQLMWFSKTGKIPHAAKRAAGVATGKQKEATANTQ